MKHPRRMVMKNKIRLILLCYINKTIMRHNIKSKRCKSSKRTINSWSLINLIIIWIIVRGTITIRIRRKRRQN